MPSFLLLLVMSLAVISHQAKDQSRPTQVAVQKTSAVKAKAPAAPNDATQVALSDVATAPPAIEIIEKEAKNLSVQSEIDAPMTVKFWASEKTELLPRDVATLIEQPIDAPVETQTVAAFFNHSARVEDWMSDDEKAMAQRFQKFIVTLQTQLENPRVYLFGERERTVVIIGKVKGGFGGVATVVVET